MFSHTSKIYIILIEKKINKAKQPNCITLGTQFSIVVGFYLSPLLGTEVMYFRKTDFSEDPATAFPEDSLLWGRQ